jgi:hypothetical protein
MANTFGRREDSEAMYGKEDGSGDRVRRKPHFSLNRFDILDQLCHGRMFDLQERSDMPCRYDASVYVTNDRSNSRSVHG